MPAGEVVAVLGPNGAGKSTALHVVTGLVRPDSGLVRLGDRVLTDTGTGVNVATHDRRVGLLLQDPLLFPHLSVADNVAFAPRAQRRGKAVARERALHWLREVGADEFADRKPRELSGGQAQRVAIARALAGEPDVLLLDEPMAGLDVAVAAAIRAVLRRVLARDGRSAMLVTHDLLDVVTLADHVLVLEDGRVAETGRTADVLGAPRSGFGARLAGVNVVTGTVESDGVLRTPTGEFWHGIPAVPLTPGQPAVAVFPPAAVAVYRRAAARAARATSSKSPSPSSTPAGPRSGCAPSPRRASRQTSPPTPRRICGWRPVAGCGLPSRPRRSSCTAREPVGDRHRATAAHAGRRRHRDGCGSLTRVWRRPCDRGIVAR